MKSPSIKNYAKMGFGLGLGAAGVHMIFGLIGMLLLLWGTSLLKKARRSGGSLVPAYAVMVMGVVIGLGLGATSVLSEASANF